MIIQIGNQKGGCGKSTLAVNIAAALACDGKDVIIVDADRQATSSNWSLDRLDSKEGLPRVSHVQVFDNIRDTVLDLGKRYEYVIVDTAGRDSRELRTGMTAADLLIVPFKPSQPDLDVLPYFQEVVTGAKDFNPGLVVRAILNIAPTNPSITEVQDAQSYLQDYADFVPYQTVVRDRKVFRDSMSLGKGAVEMDNEKAIAEINSLLKEIYGCEKEA